MLQPSPLSQLFSHLAHTVFYIMGLAVYYAGLIDLSAFVQTLTKNAHITPSPFVVCILLVRELISIATVGMCGLLSMSHCWLVNAACLQSADMPLCV